MSNDITTRERDTHDRDLSPVTSEEDSSKTRGSVSLRHPFGVSSVEQTHSPLLRYVACVILMMVVGVSEMWGATITYHIINLGRLDNSGQLTSDRTEALQFTSTSTIVEVPSKYKSPLAKNWKYYKSDEITYNETTKAYTFAESTTLEEGNSEMTKNADIYVTYELDKDKFRDVGIYNRGIYRIRFPKYNNKYYYLRQTTWKNQQGVDEINTDSYGDENNPTSPEFLWKINIVDPYQITIQSQSTNYLNHYLSSKTGNATFSDIRLQSSLGNAKATKAWAFSLLNGEAAGTYRLIVTDGSTVSPTKDNKLDSFGHGYLNNRRENYKTTYHLYNQSDERRDLTFEPVTRNYIIVNNSGQPIVQALTEEETLVVPDVIKSPLASYTFYGTQQDAIEKANSISSATGATIYVRYTTNNDVLNLRGEVKYNISVGGTNYLYAADAATLSSEATSDNNANNNHKWILTGNDAYQIAIKNVDNSNEITYDVSSGEAVPTLSATGSKFFLHQTSSGNYEVVAITSNDYSTPDYYTLGLDAGNLKLYSNSNHPFGNAAVQTVFTPRPTATITTLPEANSLTYNGSNQELVTAGTAENGTMKYRLGDTGSYETSIPTAKDVNTYNVYYMAAGADGYEDFVASEPVEVTINKQSIIVSGITASNKTYDGNTSATLVYTGATLTGKVGSEDLTVSATGTFADKNVGTGKTVTISELTLGGSAVGNYTLAESGQQVSTTADITAKDITASGTITASSKVYDGTTTAVFDYSGVTLTGKVEGDDISYTATGTFADKNVGTGKSISISSQSLSGADVGNYNLTSSNVSTSTTASITAAEITVSGITAENKVYNGNTTATLNYSGVTFIGKIDGDVLTVTATGTFEDANVGTGKTVTISNLTLGGADAGNYTLAGSGQQETTTADIIAQAVTITLTMNGWTYGTDPKDINPSIVIEEYDANNATKTFYYKVKDSDDATYTTTKPTKTSNAGTYTVKVVVEPYQIYDGGEATTDFTIAKAKLTIKAVAKAKDYLDPDPEFTYTVSGLKNSERQEDVLKDCNLQRVSGENVGTYNISINETTFEISPNYTHSFTGAKLTINKKNLGDGETPAQGIGINVKDGSPKTVSVFNGENALLSTDYTYDFTDNVVTITAAGNNCTGSAQATYSSVADNFFYPLDANDANSDKIAVYISTSDQMASADLVPCIVGQVNPTMGTLSVIPVSYIPKDVPVILLAKHDVTGITTSTKNENTPAVSEFLINNNKLNIAPEDGVPVENTEAYIFYKGEFVLTTAGTITAGKYFLYNPNYQASADSGTPTPAPARSLAIIKGETTGLIQLIYDEVKEGENAVWYTIDGQKLNKKPTRKGLYIQNGKKHIVK